MLHTPNPVPEDIRFIALSLLRHEYGHYFAARSLGFQTGAVTLKVFLTGGHEGTSEVFLDMPLTGVDAILDYLKRRIVMLFSGVVAQHWGGPLLAHRHAMGDIFRDGGESDHEKIMELLTLHLNISHPSCMENSARVDAYHALKFSLFERSKTIVQSQYAWIERLASEHVNCLTPNKKGWSWGLAQEELEARIESGFT